MKVSKEQIDILVKILDVDGKILFISRQWLCLKKRVP